MDFESSIYVAGHTGLVGTALLRELQNQGYRRIVTRTHAALDLTNRLATERFFAEERPEYVFLAAARVGGILRNRTFPAEMIYTNLAIQCNVIDCAWRYGVKKLLFIGTACAYPKFADSPITPDTLLTGVIEPTNEPFAVAKIAGVRMCQAYNRQYGTQFVSVVPATVYGPNDHFDENGHVVASLLDRFHRAKASGDPEVVVWGTGQPRREFLFSEDFGAAMILLMNAYNESEIIHVAEGKDIPIKDLAEMVQQTVGYRGLIVFDTSKPDGMPRRQLEASPIRNLGWRPRVSLEEGLRRTYAWYLEHLGSTSQDARGPA